MADDGPWIIVLGENASCNECEHLPMVICPNGDCFDPLGHISLLPRYTLSRLQVGKVP